MTPEPIEITFLWQRAQYRTVNVRRGDVCVHEEYVFDERRATRHALKKLYKAERLRERMGICE